MYDPADDLSYLDRAADAASMALSHGAHEEFENFLDHLLDAIDHELVGRGNVVPTANFAAALVVANATRARVNVLATKPALPSDAQADIAS